MNNPPLQPDEELRRQNLRTLKMGLDGIFNLLKSNDDDLQRLYDALLKGLQINAEEYAESREQAARIVNRLEVIDHTESGTGREFVKWLSYDFKVEFDLQDEGRTLKVFLTDLAGRIEE